MEKRRGFVVVFLPLLSGIASGVNIIGNPRFASYRAVDMVHLLATGMCFGAAIALFMLVMRGGIGPR